MKISWNWLQQYFDQPADLQTALEVLTDIGLEVEGTETYTSVKGGLEGLVVGEVMFVTRHPDADRLSVTRVDTGDGDLKQIVCGAPNVEAGQKVVVAQPGVTIFPLSGDPFTIKKTKIRGIESQGMICAEDEIGLSANHEGILVLEDSAVTGSSVRELLDIVEDTVIEIGLTPNRADAMHHSGVARDLIAALNVQYNFPGKLVMPRAGRPVISETNIPFKVGVEDTDKCPRYAGVLISGMSVKPSPDWLSHYLKAIGVRTVNNVVDITNFVLHAFGQPLHAFDLAAIGGRGIRVKCLPEGTPFTTLDGQQRTLSAEDLMICDADNKPMCMAGVFGGIDSGVTQSTGSIFLESAFFNPVSIRRTASRYQLFTDASRCFEKGVDPNGVDDFLYIAVQMILEICGGRVVSDVFDIYPRAVPLKNIDVRVDRFNRVSGLSLSRDELAGIFEAMDLTVQLLNDNSMRVLTGTNKPDVTREIDLIEEALRIYSINRVPARPVLTIPISHGGHPAAEDVRLEVSHRLAALGFSEMMNLSLQPSGWFQAHLPLLTNHMVHVNNTSNQHLDAMRPTMVYGGLESMARNINRQMYDLKLFEFGKTYRKMGNNYLENDHLCLFITGRRSPRNWQKATEGMVDFYSIKGVSKLIIQRFGIDFVATETRSDEVFASAEQVLLGGKVAVNYGQVSPKLCSSLDIKQEVYMADFNWKILLESAAAAKPVFRPWSKYPSVHRDLALVVNDGVGYNDLQTVITKEAGKWLAGITLFDVYQNREQWGENMTSYGISLKLQDEGKTLNDRDVDKLMNRVISKLEQEFSAVIRR